MTEDMHEERLQAVEAFGDSFVSLENLLCKLFNSRVFHNMVFIQTVLPATSMGSFFCSYQSHSLDSDQVKEIDILGLSSIFIFYEMIMWRL